MAKYNILRENEDQLPKKEEKEKIEEIEKPDEPIEHSEAVTDETAEFSPSPVSGNKQTPGDDFFSNEIFSTMDDPKEEPEINIPDQQGDPLADETISPKSPNVDEPEGTQEPEPFPESDTETTEEDTAVSEFPPAEKKTEPLIYDYEDEKQEGLNYKPILIGVGAIAAIAIIYFLVSGLFFGDEGVDEPEQKVETTAERMQREQTERKQAFLLEVNKSTAHRMGSVHMLANLDKKNVKYSSILLYANSLDMEVFASDREGLAKFNQTLKNDQRIKEFKIASVDSRPGSAGGLFALYDMDLKSLAKFPAVSSQNISNVSPANWASTVPQRSSLTLKNQREISSRQENLFLVKRNEYELRGSLNNCLSLINHLASTNQNISVHKLSLLPMDQRKMSASSYLLKLVLDFYL